MPTYPSMYVSRAQVEAVLTRNPAVPLPSGADDLVDQQISTAGQWINQVCRRHFDLVVATRVFDAPASTRLDVADLQASPAPVVTLAGVALVAGTDYFLQPQITALHPAYTYLIRVQGGFVRRWGYRATRAKVVSVPVSRGGIYDEYLTPASPYGLYAPAASESVITIAGTWGYSATIPQPIVQVAEILAVRLWEARNTKYADTGGGGQLNQVRQMPTLFTQDLKDMIAGYIKPLGTEDTAE